MFNAERLLSGMLGSAMQQHGRGGNLGGLGGLGGLASVSKGGVAMGLLGVAMAAFEHFNEKQAQGAHAPTPPAFPPGHQPAPAVAPAPPPPPPAGAAIPSAVPPPPSATAPALNDDEARLYLRGMIAAAAADGVIDDEERQKILGHLETTGIEHDERHFLLQEMDRPASILQLSQAVQTPEQAENLYTCSLLAVQVDTEAERNHLRELAAALQLAPDRVAELNARFQVSL